MEHLSRLWPIVITFIGLVPLNLSAQYFPGFNCQTMETPEFRSAMSHYGLCFRFASHIVPVVGKSTEVVARHRVLFKEGTRVKAVANAPAVFRLGNNAPVEIELLEPDPSQQTGSIDTIQQYEKAEFGILLDSLSEAMVDRFLDTLSNPLQNELNPFDPEDIDIMAHFWHFDGQNWVQFGVSPRKRPGFFVPHAFKRVADTSPAYSNVDSNNVSWEIDTTQADNQYRFRVRFTPREIGKWRYNFEIKVGDRLSISTRSRDIYCDSSNAYDFVRLDPASGFLKVEDSIFFPIGHNLRYPDEGSVGYGHIQGSENKKRVSATGYAEFQDRMDSLRSYGANYFRTLLCPWSTEIEFERLGDYSDRMTNAWELDSILGKARQLGLRIHLNLQLHYPFELPDRFGHKVWDWGIASDYPWSDSCIGIGAPLDTRYCYYDSASVPTPKEFLTNPQAKTHYKNRLRYIIARWGYSPDIAVLELFSEINNIGTETVFMEEMVVNTDPIPPDTSYKCNRSGMPIVPYHQDSLNHPRLVYEWQKEMCGYIKDDLEHLDHLLTVNYTGKPNFDTDTISDTRLGANVGFGDSSYYLPAIDIYTFNHYHDRLSDKQHYDILSKIRPYIDRAVFISEGGNNLDSVQHCDEDCRFIKNTIIGAFSGALGTPLNWDHVDPDSSWQVFGFLDEFLSNRIGDLDRLFSFYDASKSGKAETFTLVSGKQGIGVINNLTVNFFTLTAPLSACDAVINSHINAVPFNIASPQFIPLITEDFIEIFLPDGNVGDTIQIEYFYLNNGQSSFQTSQSIIDNNKKIEIEYPMLGTSVKNSMYFIKFYEI